jgi:hypothetical protein
MSVMNKLGSFIALGLLLLGAAVPAVAQDDHDNHEEHPCGCEAEELGFKINCEDTATMLTAFKDLQSAGCAKDCTSDSCVKNFFIVQSHHDYCPEEVVPTEVEDGFHDFDEVCGACHITKQFVEGAPDCPVPVCDDGSGNKGYADAIEAGCLANCTSTVCQDAFFVLRSVHDSCPHVPRSFAMLKPTKIHLPVMKTSIQNRVPRLRLPARTLLLELRLPTCPPWHSWAPWP